jgi:hypothetical protein
VNRFWAAALACALAATAHEGGHKNLGPTKAAPDLKLAREAMAAAKRKLAADGRYSCCVKPSCSLCARVNGSCDCGANVQAGRGACGECLGGWKAGRGSVTGVDTDAVVLLTADHQACARPGAAPDELRVESEALLRAKRTMAGEKRYACCVRGGCGQCAHETSCPCGGDLAARKSGVCGECLDGWRSGRGAFDGIDAAEVTLAEAFVEMQQMMMSQQPPAAAMSMISTMLGGWTVMASGQLFSVYSAQSGPRGRDKIFSTNWGMFMASRRAGPGTLTLRSMVSGEAATVRRREVRSKLAIVHRLWAMLLLGMFSFTLIGPALATSDSEADLPACCRRDGKHHCGMLESKAGASQAGPAWQSAKCPSFPAVKGMPAAGILRRPRRPRTGASTGSRRSRPHVRQSRPQPAPRSIARS